MPIVRTTRTRGMGAGNRPDWCQVNAGPFRVHRTAEGSASRPFDCHYHDRHEYWIILRGKAKVMSEGIEYYVRAGDIVCTKAGDEHDLLEVYEDLEAVYVEEPGPPDGIDGHLHRDAVAAKGHEVLFLPLPADFPADD